MSTWRLFRPLDTTTLDFLSLGADAAGSLLGGDHFRETGGDLVLDLFGDGLRASHGELLPFGDITRIELGDSIDAALQVVDIVWDLLKILSYYNPLTDRWDTQGLLDYLFREADWFDGSDGNDRFAGLGGNDTLRGGGGIDTAIYRGSRGDFVLTRQADGWQLQDTRGREGRDALNGIERLQFADGDLALDLDGHAGMVARLIGALFGKDALARGDLVGLGLSLLDEGRSWSDLAALAVDSDLFAQAAGSHSNVDFVRVVYRHVVGTAPDDATLNHYVQLLDSGATSQATLALMASQTDLNAQQIDLAGLTEHGLAFLPAG
ncbi:DUF4214 domain-containing protein [Aquabacterium sp.]|uniref:DUF4214 domain-containing protein n=1 Tax=Aquabacterium sp. TaxID=1872578 RepID=UPI003784E8D8